MAVVAIVIVGIAVSSSPKGINHPPTAAPASGVASTTNTPAAPTTTVPPTTVPPTTTTTVNPVLFTQTGSGTQTTATFNAPTNWNLGWTYNCANFGAQGNFQIYVMPDSLLLIPV